MSACECGCGGEPKGRFLPGHDMKLKSRLFRESAGGSRRATAELKRRGWERTAAKK